MVSVYYGVRIDKIEKDEAESTKDKVEMSIKWEQ